MQDIKQVLLLGIEIWSCPFQDNVNSTPTFQIFMLKKEKIDIIENAPFANSSNVHEFNEQSNNLDTNSKSKKWDKNVSTLPREKSVATRLLPPNSLKSFRLSPSVNNQWRHSCSLLFQNSRVNIVAAVWWVAPIKFFTRQHKKKWKRPTGGGWQSEGQKLEGTPIAPFAFFFTIAASRRNSCGQVFLFFWSQDATDLKDTGSPCEQRRVTPGSGPSYTGWASLEARPYSDLPDTNKIAWKEEETYSLCKRWNRVQLTVSLKRQTQTTTQNNTLRAKRKQTTPQPMPSQKNLKCHRHPTAETTTDRIIHLLLLGWKSLLESSQQPNIGHWSDCRPGMHCKRRHWITLDRLPWRPCQVGIYSHRWKLPP